MHTFLPVSGNGKIIEPTVYLLCQTDVLIEFAHKDETFIGDDHTGAIAYFSKMKSAAFLAGELFSIC